MSSYAHLFHVKGARPTKRPPLDSDRYVSTAAGYIPIGWLALFTAKNLKTRANELCLFAPLAEARANLARRRPVLDEVFERGAVFEHLDRLDGALAAREDGYVQTATDDLYAPWTASERDAIVALLEALDGSDPDAWDRVFAQVDVQRIDDRLHASFGTTAVNACVGWLAGGEAPEDADTSVPDIEAASELVETGESRIQANARAIIAELVPGLVAQREQAAALVDSSHDHGGAWLVAQLPSLERDLRAAVYERVAERRPRVPLDPDLALRRASLASTVCTYQVGADDPAVAEALADPDPRIRARFALAYRGGGDPDDDYDDEGDPIRADPDPTWAALLADPDPLVRYALLRNERSPVRPPVTDPSPLVRASHPDTSPAELLELSASDDKAVMDSILWHERAPLSAKRRICTRLGVPPLVH
ncbi:MAG: hypothetical protein HOV81_07245 [Kofleriaceae bacterium]|nr:hypothetical protein [Kofleriaceae bacterium]